MERRSGNRQWLWWVLSLLLLGVGWLFHPRSTTAAASVPVLPVEGTYTNLSSHWEGTYRLTRVNDWVTATLSTTRSPVQYAARQRPTVLFTMPSGFRPAQAVTAVVREAQPVDAQGQTVVAPPRTFGLHVDLDGAVRYVDDARVDGVGYLAYTLTLKWHTEDAASPAWPHTGRGIRSGRGGARCRWLPAGDGH